MTQINFEDLLGTGAHFGHVTRKWHPSYKKYILMEKNGVHIINLEETIRQLDKASSFVANIVKKKGEVLFVGTKKQAKDIVQQEADRCGMFYVVERWLGGTLTNFSTIKKSIKRLQLLEKEGSSIYENLTKKEIQMLDRERIKLSDQHRGIKDMRRLPDVIVIVDASYEQTAIREAKRLGIPVVAIVDTNTDPTAIEYPIPANDDSIRTIQLIISALTDTIIESRRAEKYKDAPKPKVEAKKPVEEKPSVVKETVEAVEAAPEESDGKDKSEKESVEEEKNTEPSK